MNDRVGTSISGFVLGEIPYHHSYQVCFLVALSPKIVQVTKFTNNLVSEGYQIYGFTIVSEAKEVKWIYV